MLLSTFNLDIVCFFVLSTQNGSIQHYAFDLVNKLFSPPLAISETVGVNAIFHIFFIITFADISHTFIIPKVDYIELKTRFDIYLMVSLRLPCGYGRSFA